MRIELRDPSEFADLVETIAAHDNTLPINELGELALAGERDARGWAAIRDADEALVAFAIVDPRERTVQLGVHPKHRRQGVGTLLATAVAQDADASHWWAFGNSEAAQALAAKLNLTKVRELYQMSRSLNELEPANVPDGFSIRTFADSDAPQVAAINAIAFADHPEQGNLTGDDFNTLTRQSWFDPNGLFVATQGGTPVGFHWTKRHDDHGEVYVIATVPEVAGRGLGRALLNAGLAYLKGLGLASVDLYVESSSARVVQMYRAANFEVISSDASYAAE